MAANLIEQSIPLVYLGNIHMVLIPHERLSIGTNIAGGEDCNLLVLHVLADRPPAGISQLLVTQTCVVLNFACDKAANNQRAVSVTAAFSISEHRTCDGIGKISRHRYRYHTNFHYKQGWFFPDLNRTKLVGYRRLVW